MVCMVGIPNIVFDRRRMLSGRSARFVYPPDTRIYRLLISVDRKIIVVPMLV